MLQLRCVSAVKESFGLLVNGKRVSDNEGASEGPRSWSGKSFEGSCLLGTFVPVYEHMVLVTLNSSNVVINIHELTTGLVNQTLVHPRETFVHAIEDRAVSVILVHNHPSGSSEPSTEDLHLTRMMCSVGKIVQIPVIDHLIISRCGLTSLCRLYPDIFEKFLQ